ncbi:MAG: Uma2 family endonuclease [Phenylobacterium sp.]
MSIAKLKTMISEDEYLAGERISEVKHELIDGEVYAMSGGSANHDRIAGNLYSEFRHHLKGAECEPFGSDMMVKAGANFYYPDVSVDCDFDESESNLSTTPVIIVEVLSQSTRRIDQTSKRLSYINIPGLLEYVLIEQDFVQIEVARKRDDWRPSHYFLGDEITFEAIDLTLSVEEVYYRVHNEQMITFLNQSNS